MSSQEIALMAHLMRRAGFGATRDELDTLVSDGYEATVESLLDPNTPTNVPEDLLRRYHPDQSAGLGIRGVAAYWLYRMIHSKRPLNEKVALFWHSVFATGYPKLAQGRVLMDQIDMFRNHGMGSLSTLLVELSRDPSMIMWLDNNENHKGAINENYGRELLELFSMGVGNYSEDDIKECARAFTGWTVGNSEYMEMRIRNDSLWPYGRINLHFEFNPDDHDNGEKSFLGQKGRLTGEDIVKIICRQPATARFIARHMYSFFVADEPPVTNWPYTPPRDPEAIEALSRAYFDSGHNIGSMLRVLFNSDLFKSRESWYQKVKSPAELVSGVLRLTGEYREPDPSIQGASDDMEAMGQALINPPSVEGWHAGVEWIDTGNLVERANFASGKFADIDKPGIKKMVARFLADSGGVSSPERLLHGCLDQMGAIELSEPTMEALTEHASRLVDMEGPDAMPERKVAEMLRMVASTPEFQRG